MWFIRRVARHCSMAESLLRNRLHSEIYVAVEKSAVRGQPSYQRECAIIADRLRVGGPGTAPYPQCACLVTRFVTAAELAQIIDPQRRRPPRIAGAVPERRRADEFQCRGRHPAV